MKILVTPRSFKNSVNDEAREKLEQFAEVKAVKPEKPLTEDELIALLDGCDGYVAGLDNVTAKVIENCPQLKVISRWGVGYDKVDTAAASKAGITVTYTPGVMAVSVAELALGLMLDCARRITVQDGQVRGGAWAPINGMELFGKTVGIIGYGAIGKQLGRLTNGIGMTTYAYDPFMNEAYAKEHNVLTADIDFIVRNCDIVSVHVPYMESTKNIISRERIFSMKDGTILINAARGGLVDEAAAAEALQSGKLAAAAFDAFEQEPLKDSPLLTAPNAILLPHTGSHTVDATKRMGMLAVDNVIRELSGTNCGYRVK